MAEAASSSYTPGSSGTSLDDVLSPSQEQIEGVAASAKDVSDKMMGQADRAASTIRSSREAFDRLEPPKLMDIPEAPTPEMRDPLQAFGSTASLVGMLASTLTRRPLVHALNAASGVMNAYRQQDLQGAKLQFETFKAQMDNAKTLHDWQMDIYKSAMDKMDKDQRGATAELEAYAHAFKDPTMLAVLKSGDPKTIYDYVMANNSAWGKMQGLMPKLQDYNAKTELYTEWLNEHPNATNEERTARYTRIFNPAAAATQARADQATSGELTPDQTMDNARQYYNSQFPVNSLTGTRGKTLPDGTFVPAPEQEQWIKNEWPKLEAEFKRQGKPNGPISGYVNGLPVAGRVAAPAATPVPAAKPAATTTTPIEGDFIPVPASLKDAKEGTVFQDTKGTYGKPGAYWVIRNGKAFPTTAPNAGGGGSPAPAGGGRGGEDETITDMSRFPAPVRTQLQQLALQGGTKEQIAARQKAYLNQIDPTGQFMPNAEHRDVRQGLPRENVTVTPITQTAIDQMAAGNEAYYGGTGTPIVHESALSRMLSGMEPTAQPVSDKALHTRQLDPNIAADLDRMFPAKPGERAFTDINRSANTLSQVGRDQAQQFASTQGGIKSEHDRQLKNTKLLEMAWNAKPARRTEILRQLEGDFSGATTTQKLEILKLYIADLMGRGGEGAVEAAAR